MSSEATTLLYILSTLAQTCAALAAFVGAVGLFRLQLLRIRQEAGERTLRGRAGQSGLPFGPQAASWLPIKEIEQAVEKARKTLKESDTYYQPTRAAGEALEAWRAHGPRLSRTRCVLVIFEAWNLLVIVVSLVGFNYVRTWAGAWWLSGSLSVVAVLTALITVGSVWVWTRGVET